MKVLFFGQLTDITDCSSLQVTDVRNTALLENILYERYPELQRSRYVITVDRQIIREHCPISEDVEVAFLPPFSGG